jgi:glycosyltransferase involved in cell wall biosynthesis
MSEAPLRVCVTTYRGNPRSGGQGIYVRLLTRELRDLGHEVDVWSGQPYPELFPDVPLVQVPSLDLWSEENLFKLPPLRLLKDPINRAEYARTMIGEFPEPFTFSRRVARALLRNGNGNGHAKTNGHHPNAHGNGTGRWRYDIVHDNQSLGPGLLEVRAHAPVVATIHHPITVDRKVALELAPNLYRKLGLIRWYSFLPVQQRVARGMDLVLTVSDSSVNDLQRYYGVELEKLRNVSNGINVAVFHPMPEIQRKENYLLTTLSSDSPLKGFTFLLEALAQLRKTRPQLRMKVIGAPNPRTRTNATVDKLGLRDIVEFTGKVEAEDIARAYAECTLAIVPSIYEGFGFPAGEAMACEVAVVSTLAGALPEVVGRDGKAGILVPPADAPALATAIGELLDAPERRRAMGEAGRRRVHELFSWRRCAERHVEVYREAIAERAAGAC